ncbi:MAG: putative Histone-lysine N-methyltransferase SETMAR [Streblomastix strix]|uniref:Putative Histone-lysine N-methyltransferase SETMAR n=1 Tax=Streblomastix strix TaxID=222440 RepID=A0A5J4X154_9EUKA|nr:MAG: putative Histone-lysine N-methyltransferase SETMAR [Streblomastix strix]
MVKRAMQTGHTTKERIKAVKLFYKYGSAKKVLENWKRSKKPDRRFNTYTVKKFERTGSVLDKKGTGRKKSATKQENVQRVENIFDEKSTSPVRDVAREAGLSLTSAERIKLSLHMHSYRLQRRQELQPVDFTTRKAACQALIDKAIEIKDFSNKIYWSEECFFELSGHVNTFNCYYHSQCNPHYTIDIPHSAGSLIVWCSLSSKGLIGPFFIMNTIDQWEYQSILGDIFQVELNIKAKSTKTFLEEMFGNSLIGKGLNLEWPPRSPDLTPLDFFLWEYLRDQVYEPRPPTLLDLKFAIIREAEQMTTQIIMKHLANNLIDARGQLKDVNRMKHVVSSFAFDFERMLENLKKIKVSLKELFRLLAETQEALRPMFDRIEILFSLNDYNVGLVFNFDEKSLRLSQTLSTYLFTVGEHIAPSLVAPPRHKNATLNNLWKWVDDKRNSQQTGDASMDKASLEMIKDTDIDLSTIVPHSSGVYQPCDLGQNAQLQIHLDLICG